MSKRLSDWKWVTSDSMGAGVDLGVSVGASISSITLQHPRTGAQKFHFFEVAVGVGFGLEKYPSVSGSSEDFFSDGSVYMLPSFEGMELRSEDFEGFILAREMSASVGVGYSGKSMFVGISTSDFIKGSLDPNGKAPALILSSGNLAGSIGIGATINSGYLWQGNVIPDPITLSLLAPNEMVSMSWRNTVRNQVPIVIPGDALFDFDKYNLKSSAEMVLRRVAPTIVSYWGRRIQIQGFTDSIGAYNYNIELSFKRANTVKEWFVAHNFAKASNVYIVAHGKSYPVASNQTIEGRARNRRIEIQVLPD